MRRKSERSTSKKDKSSPDKKLDKSKRTKRGRRKQSSTSSENETVDDSNPVQKMESTIEVSKNPPPTPAKDDSSEDAQDQVWRVKATEGSGDVGEIQKLKICLTRPPSTPERVDRSPRSKRKHSRGTSSSDTISVEGVDDKKKMKHRSKKSHESKDDKSIDSQGEDPDPETEAQQDSENSNNDVSQSGMLSEKVAKDSDTAEPSVSTTDEGVKNETEVEKKSTEQEEKKEYSNESESQKPSSVDTVFSANCESKVIPPAAPEQDSNAILNKISTVRQRSLSVDKSEILEIHAEESKCESSDYEVPAKPKGDLKDDQMAPEDASTEKKVSNIEEIVSKESNSVSNISNKTDVIETFEINNTEIRRKSIENYELQKENVLKEIKTTNEKHSQGLEHSDSIVSNQETFANGQPTPVPTRKRRWGSRSTKLSKQRSITISTDVLKEIIPDVKPAEFDEVIEEKKHKRIEMHDKPERPILPKIVIDNTENFGNNKDYHGPKQYEEKERDHKSKESQLATNRKISIVKDNDSILARPPSPPRNKQSCILFITNLVRPFTLPQLKNLLQRTGRIEENGFWIDRIKSKCFVKYETEDQAVETRHALHGVTWPVSNPKSLQVDFSTQEAFDKAKLSEETDGAPVSTIPGTVEDWLREQDLKRERGELEKPWERKLSTREWDLGKNEKDKEKDKLRRDDHPVDKRRHRSLEKSPEPARKFKKKEEEAPAKLLDDLFRKTKTTPCIYWLPLSAETIAIKEEQRRQHMAEHERRVQELRRTQRRH